MESLATCLPYPECWHSWQFDLLGVKIIELFLRSILPVLTATKQTLKQLPREEVRLIPYPFHIYSFFLRVVTCDLASSFPFSLEGEKKRFLFSLEVYVVNTPFFIQYPTKIHSTRQFFTGSFAVHLRDHLRSRIICRPFWGSFAVLYSTDVVLLIKSISFMTFSLSSPLVKLPMFA